MKPHGEIDPELHGLLDEVVGDPRSSLRLTPRTALSRWFDCGDRLRPHDGTAAERQLLEVHREALAELLIRASRIAYWKAPDMGIVPHRADGSAAFPPLDPDELGQKIESRLRAYPRVGCPELAALVGRGPGRNESLALASAALALVPSDEARHAVAIATPWNQPETALAVLEPLSRRVRAPETRVCVLSAQGARLCSLGRLREALDVYLQCRDLSEISAIQEYYIFNLSCYLEDAEAARVAAQRLQEAPWLGQFAKAQRSILTTFARSLDHERVRKARTIASSHVDGSIAANAVSEAMS